MLLQNNCKNNDVTNGLKQKKKRKKHRKIALYGKIKEKRDEDGWLIGTHTQNISYLSTLTKQHKSSKWCLIRLLMRIKARKARINDG